MTASALPLQRIQIQSPDLRHYWNICDVSLHHTLELTVPQNTNQSNKSEAYGSFYMYMQCMRMIKGKCVKIYYVQNQK